MTLSSSDDASVAHLNNIKTNWLEAHAIPSVQNECFQRSVAPGFFMIYMPELSDLEIFLLFRSNWCSASMIFFHASSHTPPSSFALPSWSGLLAFAPFCLPSYFRFTCFPVGPPCCGLG